MSCPSCDVSVNGHHYHSDGVTDETGVVEYADPDAKQQYNREEAKKTNPYKFMFREKKDLISTIYRTDDPATVMILYCAKFVRESRGANLTFTSNTKLLTHVGDDSPDAAYCADLQAFFAYLHPQIAIPSTIPYAQMPTLTITEFLDDALENTTPLLSALFGLGTGVAKIDAQGKISQKRYQDYQSQLLAIAVARDMVLRSSSRYPCLFQLMLGEYLDMENITQYNRDTMSRLRIIPSRKYSQVAQCKEVVEDLKSDRQNLTVLILLLLLW